MFFIPSYTWNCQLNQPVLSSFIVGWRACPQYLFSGTCDSPVQLSICPVLAAQWCVQKYVDHDFCDVVLFDENLHVWLTKCLPDSGLVIHETGMFNDLNSEWRFVFQSFYFVPAPRVKTTAIDHRRDFWLHFLHNTYCMIHTVYLDCGANCSNNNNI